MGLVSVKPGPLAKGFWVSLILDSTWFSRRSVCFASDARLWGYHVYHYVYEWLRVLLVRVMVIDFIMILCDIFYFT